MDLQLGVLWNGPLDIKTPEQNQAWIWSEGKISKFPTKRVWRCLTCSAWADKGFTSGTWGLFVASSRFGFKAGNEIESTRFGQEVQRALQKKTKGNVCGTSARNPLSFLSAPLLSLVQTLGLEPPKKHPEFTVGLEKVLVKWEKPWNAQGVFSSISWYK